MKLEYPLYPLFTPPFRFAEIEKMSKNEARAAFEWFVAESPKRIALLTEAVKRDTGVVLDFSEESLITVWKWAIPYFTPRNTPPCGISMEETGMKPSPSNEGLHIVGQCLTYDVGYYLAEVMMRRCPSVKWMLWVRKTFPHNQAVLSGFSLPTSPRHMVQKRALYVLEGNVDSTALADAFRKTIETVAPQTSG
jgi:hypothetical protein